MHRHARLRFACWLFVVALATPTLLGGTPPCYCPVDDGEGIGTGVLPAEGRCADGSRPICDNPPDEAQMCGGDGGWVNLPGDGMCQGGEGGGGGTESS